MNFIKLTIASPEINPQSRKAKSIPIFNPFNQYGRVFFFSWLGFMIAFLSWYAFPPLLTVTIKKDLNMTATQVANSNIVALLGTFLMRFLAGPLCDRFGPRLVFVGLLLAGAVPTAMAGLVTTPKGLIALRFFVGVLGATFVPCQVWCTGFFDKNVVGTANALAGGWGNAGGGITYFVMPAVFDSLVHSRGLSPHQAWRVAYIVPFIIIVVVALTMLLTCDDTPTGKWSERHIWMKETPFSSGDVETQIETPLPPNDPSSAASINNLPTDPEKKQGGAQTPMFIDREAQHGVISHVDLYDRETVVSLTFREASSVIFSLSTLSLAAPYACSFGSELAINSILGAYYAKNFPHMGQTQSGRWAAMFGLLNVPCRPAGGFVGDFIYSKTGGGSGSVWMKKIWLSTLGLLMGGFQLAIGLANPRSEATMFGLTAGLAFFLEACNGANFAVVPHVHPYANGIVSGIVGGMGNFGGIVFAIIFRYNGSHYDRALWIIGVIAISVNLAVCWIRPVPRQ